MLLCQAALMAGRGIQHVAADAGGCVQVLLAGRALGALQRFRDRVGWQGGRRLRG